MASFLLLQLPIAPLHSLACTLPTSNYRPLKHAAPLTHAPHSPNQQGHPELAARREQYDKEMAEHLQVLLKSAPPQPPEGKELWRWGSTLHCMFGAMDAHNQEAYFVCSESRPFFRPYAASSFRGWTPAGMTCSAEEARNLAGGPPGRCDSC